MIRRFALAMAASAALFGANAWAQEQVSEPAPAPVVEQAPAAQVAEPPPRRAPANNAERAADALLDGMIPGVSDEMTRQLSEIDFTDKNMSAEQEAAIREQVDALPALVRSAMEQRWVPREPPVLPAAVLTRFESMISRSHAGQTGELGTQRPPTRDVVTAALQERFTDAQLGDIAVFLESPAGRSFAYQQAVRFIKREGPSPNAHTPEDRNAIAAFMRTPSGSAFSAGLHPVTWLVVEQLRLNTMTHGRELMLEFARVYCAVAGPDCGL